MSIDILRHVRMTRTVYMDGCMWDAYMWDAYMLTLSAMLCYFHFWS
jgi:hypothetical protein